MGDDTEKPQLVRIQSEWSRDALKEHLEKMIKAEADVQDSKWKSQEATNLASNEWRGTIGDLKRDFVPRSEFSSLEARFVADQLATARSLSQSGGEKAGAMETRNEGRASIATVIGIAVGVATLISILVGAFIRSPTPSPAPAQVQIPQGYVLVPIQK